MAPPTRAPRALKKGEPKLSGRVSVDLPRVELESSDEESRLPSRQEADRNPGDGTGSTPGAGTSPGDDQQTTQGSGTAGQTPSAE